MAHSRGCGFIKDRRQPCSCGSTKYTVEKATQEADYYKIAGGTGLGPTLVQLWQDVAIAAATQASGKLKRSKYE